MSAGDDGAPPREPDQGRRESFAELKTRARREAKEEARQADETEAALEERVGAWKRRALWLGIGFTASAVGVVLFSDLGPFHNLAEPIGKTIVLLAMCLLFAFLYAIGAVYAFWRYLGQTKEDHRRFAPPGSKYRSKG